MLLILLLLASSPQIINCMWHICQRKIMHHLPQAQHCPRGELPVLPLPPTCKPGPRFSFEEITTGMMPFVVETFGVRKGFLSLPYPLVFPWNCPYQSPFFSPSAKLLFPHWIATYVVGGWKVGTGQDDNLVTCSTTFLYCPKFSSLVWWERSLHAAAIIF